MRDDFAVFILSHGRPDNIITIDTLNKAGYTGKIYIIIDDEDATADKYYANFGDRVVMFSKKEMDGKFDIGDNLSDRRVVVYARNKCHDIAKQLGLTYFLELDDDYDQIAYRKDINGVLGHKKVKQADRLFELMIDFLDVTNAKTVAFAQGGDFIGGVGSRVWRQRLTRKAMNSFFCRADRPFQFYGRINEDTTMYCILGAMGELVFTIADVMINQKETQQNSGGLTDIYVDMGTYYKSFLTVMYAPSCVRVCTMGNKHRRLHHRIDWNACTPKIISERYKK